MPYWRNNLIVCANMALLFLKINQIVRKEAVYKYGIKIENS
jgi:hypothetical protein